MSKKDYTAFKATDFLLDEDFCRWQTTKDRELTLFWESWVADHPGQKAEIEAAIKLFKALKFRQEPISESVIEEEWQKLRETVDPTDDYEEETTAGNSRHWWIAAATVLSLLISGAWYFLQDGHASGNRDMMTRTAPKGQRMTVLLNDGTQVLLNSGSTITYPKTFEKARRQITLEGEAFFDVAPDSLSPFMITSGEVTTEVVGTSFGIAAYPGAPDVHVAVVSGKVNVYSTESDRLQTKLSLVPNQMATFRQGDRLFAVSPFDREKQLAWVNGTLYFEKADFASVMSKLENWYGVTVVVDPDLEPDPDLFLTGKFRNKSLEYVLDSYRYPGRFGYTIRNDTVTIQSSIQ